MKTLTLSALALFANLGGCGTEEPRGKAAPANAIANEIAKQDRVREAHSIPERVWDAFEAATGHRSNFGAIEEGYVVATRPARIVELPFGPALLTEVEIEQGCHGCVGAIGVYYLKRVGDGFQVKGRWPRAIEGWTFGLPPTDWHLTDRFTGYPAIYATGGFLAQGITTAGATITELRPTGPVESAPIGTYYDDEGDPETKRAPCKVEGRIANVRKDRSFDVVVSGSVEAIDRYAMKGGRFVARSQIRWNDPCHG